MDFDSFKQIREAARKVASERGQTDSFSPAPKSLSVRLVPWALALLAAVVSFYLSSQVPPQ
jgi:hypothetical protein